MALEAFDDGPDPDQFGLWHSGAPAGSLNFAGPLVPKQALIDKDLEDGRANSDPTARRAAYADFQNLTSDAAPALFLFEPHYDYIVLKRVQGCEADRPGDRNPRTDSSM